MDIEKILVTKFDNENNVSGIYLAKEVTISSANNEISLSENKKKESSINENIPALKFRDLIIAKKFGSSPYDNDR